LCARLEEELGLQLNGHEYWKAFQGDVVNHVYVAPLDAPADSLTLLEGERLTWTSPEAAFDLPLVAWVARTLAEFHESDPCARFTAVSESSEPPG
jgi:hypothetical protein